MDRSYEKHYVSRWIAETELTRVTAWVRSYSAALRPLNLPEVTVSYGSTRTMQVWRCDAVGRGEPVLVDMGTKVPGGYKTNMLVKQVQVHVRALLPASAAAFGLTPVVYELLLSKFRDFIEAPLPKGPQTVLFAVFFAHLDFVLRTQPELKIVKGRLSIEHGTAAVRSIAAGDAPHEDMMRGHSLVSHMNHHQDKMSDQARRFFRNETMSVQDASGSDVMSALRLYAWATGRTVHLLL